LPGDLYRTGNTTRGRVGSKDPLMPAKIRIDFKRSFSITVLRKKSPNIERGI